VTAPEQALNPIHQRVELSEEFLPTTFDQLNNDERFRRKTAHELTVTPARRG